MIDHMASFADPRKGRPRIVAVNWGPWADAGMAKEGTKAYDAAVKDGDIPLKSEVALRCLGQVLHALQEEPHSTLQFAVLDTDWSKGV